MELKVSKYVSALPGTLTADTIYYVKTGSGFDMYVTNSIGTIVAYPINIIPTAGSVTDTMLATSYIKADGTRALSANWDAGAFSATHNSVVVGNATNSIAGGVGSGGNFTLRSTTHATKGKILFGTSTYDETNNRLGIGTTSPAESVDISNGNFVSNVALNLGGDIGALTRTANTRKAAYMTASSYGNSSKILLLSVDSQSALTAMTIGGASNQHYCATQIQFFTAANNTTVTGTARLTIDSSGKVGIGVAPSAVLHVAATNATIWAISGTAATNYSQMVFGEGTTTNNYAEFIRFSNASAAGSIPGAFIINNTNKKIILSTSFAGSAYGQEFVLSGNNVGLGQSTPTAVLHIKAGTATANTAPLKLTAGTNLTVVENGAFEYDGTNLYFTTGGVRKTVTLV